MKTKKLLQAMGDIRPEYIEAALKSGTADGVDEAGAGFVPEVSEPQRHSVLSRIVTAAGLVACTAFVAGCGVWMYRTGRAARELTAASNSAGTQVLEVEPATAPADGPEQSSAGTGEQTSAPDSGSAAQTETTAGGEPEQTDKQTTAGTDSGSGSSDLPAVTEKTGSTDSRSSDTGTASARETESTGLCSGVQTTVSTYPVSSYPAGMNCVLFRNYGIHTQRYPEQWRTGEPVSCVLHSLVNIQERNMSGDLLDEAFMAFLEEDATKDWRTDAFFEKNDVIVGAVYLNSGSYELGVRQLGMVSSGATGKTVLRLNLLGYQPECMDCAMCCYYYAISVPKGVIEGYMRVETALQWIKPEYDPVTGSMTDDRLNFWRESCWREPAMYFAIED